MLHTQVSPPERPCWILPSSTHLLEVLLGDEATGVCDIVLEGFGAHNVLEFQKHVEKLEDHLHVGRGLHEHVHHLPCDHAVDHVPCRSPESVCLLGTLCVCSLQLKSHPRPPGTHQVSGCFPASSGKRATWELWWRHGHPLLIICPSPHWLERSPVRAMVTQVDSGDPMTETVPRAAPVKSHENPVSETSPYETSPLRVYSW